MYRRGKSIQFKLGGEETKGQSSLRRERKREKRRAYIYFNILEGIRAHDFALPVTGTGSEGGGERGAEGTGLFAISEEREERERGRGGASSNLPASAD